jgi:excisionase family DNA binding protein
MAKPLTLAEMADELRFCTKTFRKYVKEYRIPHSGLGRNMRFNKDQVISYLEERSRQETDKPTDLKPAKLPAPKSANRQNFSEYYEALGL